MIQTIKTTEATYEWLHIFQIHEIAAARVNMVDQAFEDPAILANNMARTIGFPSAGTTYHLKKP